ncbi:MAG: GNAT family N-acetyltransferase [Anaerostipes sp.]|uniref:GNAT family N-acetyltransferase n=1 Tax=Anaerostipes sp. TaxID=1872530 RepID=UPI003995402A
MVIREYQTLDGKELRELFYHTVHTVNAKDYTKEQLDVWAERQADLEQWNQSFQEHYSIVAVEGDMIAGFGDIDKNGYLDRLFVHADFLRKGIGTAICDRLEQKIKGKILTHASITARPFFEERGYKVIKEQKVERSGVLLTNFVMEKEIN